MDIQHCLNLVQCENRFIKEQGLGHDSIFDLLVALRVNNFQACQCLTTVSQEKTLPIIVHGAGLIFNHYERNNLQVSVAHRSERVALGAWILHFGNLLDKVVPMLCDGNESNARGLLHELFVAMLACSYQFGARLRKGYEVDKPKS